jgi:hypothetical protein
MTFTVREDCLTRTLLCVLSGQPYSERRALTWRALGGRDAAVCLSQFAHDRQAEAAAAGLPVA